MYDPFKWADAFNSEEEYLLELMKENEVKENDKTRNYNSRTTDTGYANAER